MRVCLTLKLPVIGAPTKPLRKEFIVANMTPLIVLNVCYHHSLRSVPYLLLLLLPYGTLPSVGRLRFQPGLTYTQAHLQPTSRPFDATSANS